ncbi:MAG: amino acid permease [Actinomycetota bacterium]|nr:amino acid permease [Actinomycetota bacterium]MDA8209284.1 amino acid permease [Actinomycetota bacterium]
MTDPHLSEGPHPELLDADTKRLHALGYAQELRRSMSGFSNFAVSFTIISILSGALTLYGYGMNTGGPSVMVWGWIFVGAMTTIVGLGMAEISSAYPTAGGLYYWSAKLAKKNGAAWSWFTGWFNLLGQVAVTAGIDFGFALFFTAFLDLTTGIRATHGTVLAVYGITLLAHGVLNNFGVKLVAFLSNVSAWWHILGVAVIVIVLMLVPAHHASASFVFTKFVNNTGFHSSFYVVLIGLLMAQYTFTGYDASAHMSEETVSAAMKVPRGIVNSIVVSLVAGLVLIVGVTFAITNNYNSALSSATGVPPVQIWMDAIGRRGGEFLLVIAMVAQFFCGMASVAANSRMVYAFSRDGAVPGSRFWHHINPRTRTPTRSIWFAAVFAFILGVPAYWSTVAYGAVTSIATIGLYIAYVTPTLLRRLPGSRFEPGPWNLGKWSKAIGWVGIVWVAVITVLFMLPEVSPITRDTFNYAPIAVVVVLAYAGIFWAVSARKWFTGPRMQGSELELEAIETRLETAEELEETF